MVRQPVGPLIGPKNLIPWYDFCHSKSLNFPLSPISEIWSIFEKEFLIQSQLTNWKFISEIFIAYSHNSANFRILTSKLPILTMPNTRLTSARFYVHSLIILMASISLRHSLWYFVSFYRRSKNRSYYISPQSLLKKLFIRWCVLKTFIFSKTLESLITNKNPQKTTSFCLLSKSIVLGVGGSI